MPKFSVICVTAGLLCSGAALWPAIAAEGAGASIPNFNPDGLTAWTSNRPKSDDFLPPASGPGPVLSDPAHPYVPNGQGQPTYRIADLTNPILKPWVVEVLRKTNADAGSGKAMFTRESRCWPTGVPAMLLNPILLFFVQTPKEVWIIQQADHRVRRVLLDQQHSANPKPTWYGESVGHYEGGDTLVIDTIGMNDKSFVDSYRTPHTGQLHVVERFKLLDGGKALEVDFTVEDPGAFNMPWSASKRWKRVQAPLAEESCAENNANYFSYEVEPLPQSERPDF